jgi:tyrosyl-tRNA synthetase
MSATNRFAPLNEQMDVIRAGAVDVLPEEELAQKIEKSIASEKPLLVKLGADPSRPDLHIGHAVVLNKMRQFQDLGHEAVLIIGDFTGSIGDPTGKSKTRPPLSLEETQANGQSYLEQATLVLRVDRLRTAHNSEWLAKLSFADVIRLAASMTVARMLERDDFTNRYKAGEPISLHEFLYPLAQGFDSVELAADVELGGTDQKFNLLVGRELMRHFGLSPQCILTLPILEGTDGVEKMSKSLNNYIALTDTPREMFGKTMSIPDTLIARYLQFGAWAPDHEVKAVEQGLLDGTVHPRHAKVDVAKRIVAKYHGHEAGVAAFEEFERMFVKKDVPDDVPEVTLSLGGSSVAVVEVMVAAETAASKGEARRLIQQGGVSVDGEKIADIAAVVDFSEYRLLKVGKRRFVRVRCQA